MTKPSDIIRKRIQDAGKPFSANDNIADFVNEEDLNSLQIEVEAALESVLDALVIDRNNDHNTNETAKRVAKMYIQEIFSGRYVQPPKITSFPNVGYKALYMSGPIAIRSTCAHHFQNIVGNAWVGIIPQDEVIGLSKFNRIVRHYAERPQIQEELTTQIATALQQYAKTEHVAVVIKAEHHCMSQRGVREHESDMTTAIMLGAFSKDPALKKEFYDLFGSMKGHSNNG